MNLWLEVGAPRVLQTLVPRRTREAWVHDPYRQLLRTYRSVRTATEYEELMRAVGFSKVTSEDLMMGSVCHLQGERPSTT